MLKVVAAFNLKNYELKKEFVFHDTTFRIFQNAEGVIAMNTQSAKGMADVTRQDLEFSTLLSAAKEYLQKNFSSDPLELTKTFCKFVSENEVKFITQSLVHYFDFKNGVQNYLLPVNSEKLFLDVETAIPTFEAVKNIDNLDVSIESVPNPVYPTMLDYKVKIVPKNLCEDLAPTYMFTMIFSGTTEKSLKLRMAPAVEAV